MHTHSDPQRGFTPSVGGEDDGLGRELTAVAVEALN